MPIAARPSEPVYAFLAAALSLLKAIGRYTPCRAIADSMALPLIFRIRAGSQRIGCWRESFRPKDLSMMAAGRTTRATFPAGARLSIRSRKYTRHAASLHTGHEVNDGSWIIPRLSPG
jgi:hypothetical protein